MSNPLDPGVVGNLPGTVGPSVGILENFSRGWDLSETQTTSSIEDEALPIYENALRSFEARIGRKTGVSPDTAIVNGLIQPIVDPDNRRGLANAWAGFDLTVYGPGDNPEKRLEAARAVDAQIRALNDPSIPSIDAVLKQVQERRRGLQESAQQGAEGSGWLGGLAQMAGAGLGVLAEGDPLAISALAGGGGGNIASRIATDLLLGGSFGAENQAFNLNPTAAALGEEQVRLLDAAYQGAIGQVLAGQVFHGLGVLVKRAYEGVKTPTKLDLDVGGDPLLRSMFEAAPESPRARAGLQLLDGEAQFALHNPYGDNTTGLRHFSGEVSDVTALMEGRTDTAVGRFIAADPFEFTLDNWNLDHETVRASQPEVFDRLVTATQRLNEVDTAIARVSDGIDNLSIADAVGRIDEASGDLVRSLENDLRQPGATNEAKALAARKIDTIVQSIGEPLVERELANAGIAPRKELQSLQASRRAANKEFRLARNTMDAAIAKNKLAEEIKLKAFGKPQADVPLSRVPVQPDRLRADVVARVAEDVEVRGEKVAADVEETRLAPTIDEVAGTVDVGGVKMRLDAKAFDFEGKETTVGALMRDIYDDENLVEAVRTCAL